MIIKGFFEWFDTGLLNENIIPIKNWKNYLDSFFIAEKQNFLNIKDYSGLQFILDKINLNIGHSYSIEIDTDDETNKIYGEVILKYKESKIKIYITDNLLLDKIAKNLNDLIENLKNIILHEFIHIEQFARSEYLHPIDSNAKEFRKLKEKYSKGMISQDKYINDILKEPYEYMAYAATFVLLLLKENSIKQILYKLKNNEIQQLNIFNKKNRNKLEKYMYLYCLELG